MADNNTLTNHLEENSNPQAGMIEDYEVEYWTEKWGITEQDLNNAVRAAGVEVANIEEWLRKNGIIN